MDSVPLESKDKIETQGSLSLDKEHASGFNTLLNIGRRQCAVLPKVNFIRSYAKETNEMAKNQTTYIPKDIYFRTPTKGFTARVVEVKAASEELDGVRYKDKYFQGQCTSGAN